MKTSWRRTLSALLTIAMILTMLVIPAAAADPAPGDVGYTWNLSSDLQFRATESDGTYVDANKDQGPYGYKTAGTKEFKGLKIYDGTSKGSGSYNKTFCIVSDGGKLEIPVNGRCTVKISTQYGARCTMGVGDDTVAVSGSGSDVTPGEYDYKPSEAGTVTINSSGDTYITKIELLELPEEVAGNLKGEVGDKWVFVADTEDTEVSAGWTEADYAFANVTDGTNFKGLTLGARSGYHQGYLYPEKGVTIPVAGACNVEVTCTSNCAGTLGVGSDTVELVADGTAVYSYAGPNKGTVELKQSSYTCVTKIKITEYVPKAVMTLPVKHTGVVMGGDSVELTATINNKKSVTSLSATDAEGKVTAVCDKDTGKVTLTAAAAGKGELTVTAVVVDLLDQSKTLTATIPVYVQPEGYGTVKESTKYNFQTKGEPGCAEFYADGLEWSNMTYDSSNGHGPVGKGKLTLHVPEHKQVDVTVTTCGFMAGTGATLTVNGTAVTGEETDVGDSTNKGLKFELTGVTDGAELVFGGSNSVHVHSIETGAFSDATKPYEHKKWEFDNADFALTTYPELTITGGSPTGAPNGLAFFSKGSITVPVNGPCNIKIVPSYAWDFCMDGNALEHEQSGGEGKSSDGLIFYYTGNAGEVTFTSGDCGQRGWMKSIELLEATEAPAKVAPASDSVKLKLGSASGSKADVDVLVRSTTGSNVSAASADEDVATAALAADGSKVTITAVGEGTTTVTLALKDDSTKTATIAVTVEGAAATPIAEGNYTFKASTDNIDIPGLGWSGFSERNNGHGPYSTTAEGGTLTLQLQKKATVSLELCTYGSGKNTTVTTDPETTIEVKTVDEDTREAADGQTTHTIQVAPAGKLVFHIVPHPQSVGENRNTYFCGDPLYVADYGIYVHGLSVKYMDSPTVDDSKPPVPGERDIDVWDFAAVAQEGTGYTNNITPAGWAEAGKLNNGVLSEGGSTVKFGDLTINHSANDRIYSTVDTDSDFVTALGSNATKMYGYEYTDYKTDGGWYCNGTGGESRRYFTIDNVRAGDAIVVYAGSTSGDTTFYFEGMGQAAGQRDAVDGSAGEYMKMVFEAKKTGTYKVWSNGSSGKVMFHRAVRIPAVLVTGTISLPQDFDAQDYEVKFRNTTTGVETPATLDGTSFTAALAPGFTYNAKMTGTTTWGFTSASKKVEIKDADTFTGKENVTLVVEAKAPYTYSGTVTGFDSAYDTANLAISMVPNADGIAEGYEVVDLTVTPSTLAFTGLLETGVVYTVELKGVDDYQVKTPAQVTSEKDDVTENIVVEPKGLCTASGKFLDLGDGRVTALSFVYLDEKGKEMPKYTYDATVTADGYTVSLRDGNYAAKATVEGTYRTTSHVVVSGANVTKDLLFVSTATKPAVTWSKDVYVGYPAKSPNYATMTEALDAVSRMGVDSEAKRVTIHIAPGTYREQIAVDTPYVTFINDEPAKGEVLLTWYYGIGYKYYSSGKTQFYDPECAYDKFEKNIAGSWGTTVRVLKDGFRAENITFENSFNRYITEEEIEDGVEVAGNEAINVARNYSTVVDNKKSTERATAICLRGNQYEFLNCKFLSSQDTVYTQGTGYFKNCLLEGQTDYVFGSGSVVFDACELSWKGYSADGLAGYITASRPADTANSKGYLFRNCTVTAGDLPVVGGYFGRPWGDTANVIFLNTKLESASLINAAGWTSMSGVDPSYSTVTFRECNTTSLDGKAVDTSGRADKSRTVVTSVTATPQDYFGSWDPYYYVEEAATVAFAQDPSISDNGDLNIPYPGHLFTAVYSLGDNDANDASIIKWYRVAEDGTETLVKSATAAADATYKVVKGDIGYKIKLEVTPMTISGKTGEAKSVTTVSKILDGYDDPTGNTDPELGDGVNIFLVGDSTVCLYAGRDEGSWGESLQSFFDKDKVTIVDHAVGGRSSRSFINEGRLDTVAAQIGEGDYLFIQFGHNDCADDAQYIDERYCPLGTPDASGKYPSTPGVKGSDNKYTYDCGGTYKWYLQQFIDVAKDAGAIPVLVTPVSRMYYTADGTIRPHHDASSSTNKTNTYCDAVKQLAQENDILCIDAYTLTKDLFEAAYTAGGNDVYGKQIMNTGEATHCNKLGGIIEGAVMAKTIQGLGLNISKAVKAPAKVTGVSAKGLEVYSINASGDFSAMTWASNYTEHATYWEGIGAALFSDIAKKAAELNPSTPGETEKTPAEKLAAAIVAAKEAAEDVKVSADGTDVYTNQKWVVQADMDAFQAAIAAAEEVAGRVGATDEALNAAIDALAAASKTFEEAQKDGSKKRPTSGGGPAIGTTTKPADTTTPEAPKPEDFKADKTTKDNGDVEVVVKDENGEVVAEVEIPAAKGASPFKFIDVPDDHWAADSINNMAAMGVVNGVSMNTETNEGVFDMTSDVTRGTVATMLFRFAHGAEGKPNSFTDVAAGAWYTDAIGWAASTGVVNGKGDGTFAPAEVVTREQLATMLYRFATLLGMDVSNTGAPEGYADAASVSSWAAPAVNWCVNAGIINGTSDTTLSPVSTATRAQTAVMLDRFIALLAK